MNPVEQFKEMVLPKDLTTSGKVEAVTDGVITASTSMGLATVLKPTNMQISVGDSILIVKGVVQGKVKNRAAVTVYDL